MFLALSLVMALPLCGQTATAVLQPSTSSYIGIVKASERVAVTPRITGTIWRQLFEEGSVVRKGQVLFEIEDTAYRASRCSTSS